MNLRRRQSAKGSDCFRKSGALVHQRGNTLSYVAEKIAIFPENTAPYILENLIQLRLTEQIMKYVLLTLLYFQHSVHRKPKSKLLRWSVGDWLAGLPNKRVYKFMRPAKAGLFFNLVPFDMKYMAGGANKITSFDAPLKINGAELKKRSSYGICVRKESVESNYQPRCGSMGNLRIRYSAGT
jgi:hypothetical protein